MELSKLKNGKRAVIRSVGGLDTRVQLLELGLVPGVPVRMIQGGNRDPLLVEVLGSTVVLGRSLARSILIQHTAV